MSLRCFDKLSNRKLSNRKLSNRMSCNCGLNDRTLTTSAVTTTHRSLSLSK